MSLCRHYVRELRRSVLIETPEAETKAAASKRSSMILEQFHQIDDAGPSNHEDEKSRDQHVSAFLRQDTGHHSSEKSRSGNGYGSGREITSSPSGSEGSNKSRKADPVSRESEKAKPHFMGSAFHDTTTDSHSPAQQVARSDLRASAEKILYTYLLTGAEREIILPQSILNDIISSIEDDHRDDPEVFDAAKDYVFQAMERDAFPGFLRSKALGNLVPPSMFARLILGLVAIFGAFWAAFVCIFLDLSRSTRCWVCTSPFKIKHKY